MLCVKATPKANALPPDHASTVSHHSVVGFCSPPTVITRTSHSDKSRNATTELPAAGFSARALGNPRFPKCLHASISRQFPDNSTGLSMELCGVSLSPSGRVDRFEHSPHEAVSSVKHLLDFEESESCIRLPKVPRKSGPTDGEPSSNADICAKSCQLPATVEAAYSDKGQQCKNVHIHESTPICVSGQQGTPDNLTTVTPVTQRSHKFLVCFYTDSFLCLVNFHRVISA